MNPETTPADGQFHWDVISDYYKVVASAPGCHAPGQAGQPTVSTPVLPVPPPWTGLELVLQCAHETAPVPPSITSLSDNVAPSVGGTQVEINGSGFMPSAKVWFGLTPSPAVSYVSPSLLVAAVPPGHGAVHVLVVTAGGRTPASSANYLTYGTSPAITGVSPASGPLAGGTQVRVRGSGLAGTELVTVGHSIVTDFSVGTNGDITLTMPAGSLGTVDVGVVTAVGTSAPTPADRFSYVVPPPWVGPGQQAPSSQIPWSRVGPGWTLAIASSQAASSATLFVVDPAGGRYRVTSSVPLDGSIAGWSGDKTSALIVASVGGATTAVIEVDLKSGKIHRFLDYPSDIDSFTYSLSSPPALLEVVSKASGQYALRRANLDGATKLTYPSEFLVSFQDGHHRAPRGPAPAGITFSQGTFLQSPDGSEIVMGLDAGLAVVSSGGKTVRVLSSPTFLNCSPQQWWQPGVVLASCLGQSGAPHQYWLMPVSGAAPTPLGPTGSTTLVWKVAGTLYGQVDQSCLSVARFANGKWAPTALPGAPRAGTRSSSAPMADSWSC